MKPGCLSSVHEGDLPTGSLWIRLCVNENRSFFRYATAILKLWQQLVYPHENRYFGLQLSSRIFLTREFVFFGNSATSFLFFCKVWVHSIWTWSPLSSLSWHMHKASIFLWALGIRLNLYFAELIQKRWVSAMDWVFLCPQNSCGDALTSNMIVFGGGALGRRSG